MPRCSSTLRTLVVAALFALSAGWAAAQVQAVVSIHPYYDLLRQVGGDRVEVTRLLPPGASPSTFDPSLRDVVGVRDADLIVLNGVVDGWLENLIEASGTEAEVLEMLAVLDAEQIVGGDHAHGAFNPHIWLDPLVMVDAVELFVARLSAIDPTGAEAYAANGERLHDELLSLDAELRELLAPVAGAPFVPFHDAWPYFAAHYGLDLVVEIEPFPGREPSPAYLAEALELIADAGAAAVFSERQLDPRPAEVVAESAGVALYVLDPLGGGEGTESYQELLRYNARVIAEALGAEGDR